MARKHEAEKLLSQGLSPSQIAAKMEGISFSSVLQYLYTRVGEGSLKVSDIFFAIPKESREIFEAAITEREGHRKIDWGKLAGTSYSRAELDLYLDLRDSPHFRGDMYEHISAIEVSVHDLIRTVLISHFGPEAWWRKGVPLKIRKDCVDRQEEDDDPIDEKYAYTTLIHLKEILDKNWMAFKNVLPKQWADKKPEFLGEFNQLNAIRNAVMHPVKKRSWSKDEFEFVRDFNRRFGDCKLADT
jgi:hypothetical protein